MGTPSLDATPGLSIRARLVWGFAIVLLLFVASGAIAIQSLSTDESMLGALQRAPMAGIVLALAVIGGITVIVSTVRSISRPLSQLQEHARRIAHGDLSGRIEGQLPAEFVTIAREMNHTAENLSNLMDAAMRTADEVASSATQLSSVSEQIAVSAGHVATAMSDVSTGAAGQVHELHTVSNELRGVRSSAESVKAGAADVAGLAAEVESSAAEKRREIQRTLEMLLTVRTDVNRASEEVAALDAAAHEINGFVSAVGRIAEQTNLLALNAAIEAARAGNAGRGFAVVADEVRKLAEQAESSAADIVKLTASITDRVSRTSQAMTVGAARVREIETVSHDIDAALTVMSTAAGRMRSAANAVTIAASGNAVALERATTGMNAVARTAENHAAAAQEISASTEQQSASCEEMTSAASTLLQESGRLRDLVGGLRKGS